MQESACPVIVLIHAPDPEFVKEASKRGIFAYITDADALDWQSSIDIVLRRFAEYHDLEGAFGRRAITERAKGILMERHAVDESAAFDMLRDRSRAANRKLVDTPPPSWMGTRFCPSSRPSRPIRAGATGFGRWCTHWPRHSCAAAFHAKQRRTRSIVRYPLCATSDRVRLTVVGS